MNTLPCEEQVMIALLGAGLETRPSSCLMRKGYRRPWAPQGRKEMARKYAPGFRRGDGLWGNYSSLWWMIEEFPSLSAPVAQLASQLPVLLVSPFWPVCRSS